jgi:hypothetical protein
MNLSQEVNYFWKRRANLFLNFMIMTGCDSAFWADITQHINGLKIDLQGSNRLVIEMFEKITALEKNLRLWELQL